jgi:Tfp pilus assembly protein PilV
MKKKSASQFAFFNLRVLIGLFVFLAGVFLALLGFGTFSNASAQPNATQAQAQEPRAQQMGQMTVVPASHSDLSRRSTACLMAVRLPMALTTPDWRLEHISTPCRDRRLVGLQVI